MQRAFLPGIIPFRPRDPLGVAGAVEGVGLEVLEAGLYGVGAGGAEGEAEGGDWG